SHPLRDIGDDDGTIASISSRAANRCAGTCGAVGWLCLPGVSGVWLLRWRLWRRVFRAAPFLGGGGARGGAAVGGGGGRWVAVAAGTAAAGTVTMVAGVAAAGITEV